MSNMSKQESICEASWFKIVLGIKNKPLFSFAKGPHETDRTHLPTLYNVTEQT